MLEVRRHLCCDRIAGTAAGISASRRQQQKAAVFQQQTAADAGTASAAEGPAGTEAPDIGDPATVPFPAAGQAPRAVFGLVRDISPHVLVLASETGESRITLAADAAAWRGSPVDPAVLRPGDHAVVRLRPPLRDVADRIWANIGRVTGTIVDRDADSLLVDEGATKPRQVVTIPPRAAGRIQVRFPNLEPGYLIDVIGLRGHGSVEAHIPATSQPVYPASQLPAPAMVTGRPSSTISGSATWHEPFEEPLGLLGVTYPALDPEAGCAEIPVGGTPPGVTRLPYLAVGSQVLIRNDCSGSSRTLPVTGCAAVARLFNDRCVTCGTSPRGRIADLTLASFIALGGELERGCFNATITIGR
jgi:hypothetical protein